MPVRCRNVCSDLLATGLDRRHFVGGAVTALAGGLISRPTASCAATPGVHRWQIGGTEFIMLSDGSMELPVNHMVPGRERAEIDALHAHRGRSFKGIRSEVNVTLIKTGDQLILVDAGGGPDFMATIGKLPERLDAAGIKTDAITKVVFTHAHGDHFWGIIDPLSDDTMLEKAEHLMASVERDYWLKPGMEKDVPETFRGMALGTQRRMKVVAPRIRGVAAETEIAPGILLVDTAGHTPGHVSVLVRSGSEQVLVGGDVLINDMISFAAPDWHWGPDHDNDRAVATRRRILDRLANEHTRLVGYHLPWPGIGMVERHDAAYRFVPT